MLLIEIPMPTPSLNRLQRMHFHARKRLRDQYERICRARASSLHRARPGEHKCIRIERHAARELDHDNFVGGCKPLVDALNRAGLIWDDNPKHLRVEYRQVKATGKTARTLIVLP